MSFKIEIGILSHIAKELQANHFRKTTPDCKKFLRGHS